jgi:hypothetical protein
MKNMLVARFQRLVPVPTVPGTVPGSISSANLNVTEKHEESKVSHLPDAVLRIAQIIF